MKDEALIRLDPNSATRFRGRLLMETEPKKSKKRTLVLDPLGALLSKGKIKRQGELLQICPERRTAYRLPRRPLTRNGRGLVAFCCAADVRDETTKEKGLAKRK